MHDDIIVSAVAMMSSCTLAECCDVKVPRSPLTRDEMYLVNVRSIYPCVGGGLQ